MGGGRALVSSRMSTRTDGQSPWEMECHTPIMGFFEHQCMATLGTLRSARLFLSGEGVLVLVRRLSSEGCRDDLCLG